MYTYNGFGQISINKRGREGQEPSILCVWKKREKSIVYTRKKKEREKEKIILITNMCVRCGGRGPVLIREGD
jgi:hypothetical protein